METGDIIIVLDEIEHGTYKRKGSDLIYEMVKSFLQVVHFLGYIFTVCNSFKYLI